MRAVEAPLVLLILVSIYLHNYHEQFLIWGVATVGSNVYIFGGMRKEYNIYSYIYKFDVDTETITTLSAILPKAIHSMGVGQVGSNIYLFGGL